MGDRAAACAWGGWRGPLGGGSRRRTRLGSLASSDDRDPVVILRRIHVRGVVESLIYRPTRSTSASAKPLAIESAGPPSGAKRGTSTVASISRRTRVPEP